jgi:hypothetical protein
VKKFYLILYIILLSGIAFSQNWAPIGAKWFHSLPVNLTSGINGYIKTEVKADTVLNGIPCKVVNQVYKLQDLSLHQTFSYHWPDFYTYEDNGKIYVSKGGSFFMIQNWNAQSLDTVPFLWQNLNFAPATCDSIGYMIIDSIGSVNINGTLYRQQFVHYYDSIISVLPIFDIIIEHFGAINHNFFFTRDVCDSSIVEVYDPIGLTCYFDSTLNWTYFGQGSPGADCDYLSTGIEELCQENIFIYPNPASENVSIYFPGKSTDLKVQLIDLTGKILVEKIYSGNKNLLDIRSYCPGYYFVKIQTPRGDFIKKIIIL